MSVKYSCVRDLNESAIVQNRADKFKKVTVHSLNKGPKITSD